MRVRPSPPFGDYIDFEDATAAASTIVVAVNDGFGYQPVRVLLPHQLYVRELRDFYQQHREVYVLPVTGAATWLKVPRDLTGESA